MRGDYLFTEEQVRVRSIDENARLKGRIYRINKDYKSGIIYRPYKGSKKEIYFEMGDFVSRTNFEKARVGSNVTFRLEMRDDRPYAVDARIEGHIHENDNKCFLLPNGERVNCKSVRRYGITNDAYLVAKDMGMSFRDLKESGYENKDFYCIYLKTTRGFYKIYKNSVPLNSVTYKVENLDDYLKYLDKEVVGISTLIEREPKKFKARKVDGVWCVVEDDSKFYHLGDIIPELWDGNSQKSFTDSRLIYIESGKMRIRDTEGSVHEIKYHHAK